MIDENNVPDIEINEELSRCIVFSKHVRSPAGGDKTEGRVKPNAFVPHPYDDLSVNRHLQYTEDEVWELCQQVAQQLKKTLYGRATANASDFQSKKLTVRPDPVRTENPEGLPPNPNHAIVLGWPEEKSAQLAIAQDIADACRFFEPPQHSV